MKKQPERFDMYRKPNKPKWYLKIVEYIAAPIYMVFSNGRVKTDKEVIKMAKTFNSTKFQILTKIVIPANIGTFINSLKVDCACFLYLSKGSHPPISLHFFQLYWRVGDI